jgi:putative pyruvate formate lyase activating enzyme
MYRQVGELVIDESGAAQKGLIVRHLILPNGIAGSRESLTWLAKDVSSRVTVSLMSQYHPMHRASQFPLLARQISLSEYEDALRVMEKVGLEEGWAQDMASHRNYLPDFEREGHPHPFKF